MGIYIIVCIYIYGNDNNYVRAIMNKVHCTYYVCLQSIIVLYVIISTHLIISSGNGSCCDWLFRSVGFRLSMFIIYFFLSEKFKWFYFKLFNIQHCLQLIFRVQWTHVTVSYIHLSRTRFHYSVGVFINASTRLRSPRGGTSTCWSPTWSSSLG